LQAFFGGLICKYKVTAFWWKVPNLFSLFFENSENIVWIEYWEVFLGDLGYLRNAKSALTK
jgi:hypothetical protein